MLRNCALENCRRTESLHLQLTADLSHLDWRHWIGKKLCKRPSPIACLLRTSDKSSKNARKFTKPNSPIRLHQYSFPLDFCIVASCFYTWIFITQAKCDRLCIVLHTILELLQVISALEIFLILPKCKMRSQDLRTDIQTGLTTSTHARVPSSAVRTSLLCSGVPSHGPISSYLISLSIQFQNHKHNRAESSSSFVHTLIHELPSQRVATTVIIYQYNLNAIYLFSPPFGQERFSGRVS